MTNEQILTKAIEKAKKNGFDITKFYPLYYVDSKDDKPFPVEGLLTNHDFAKAFWGEGWILTGDSEGDLVEGIIEKGMRAYRHHLQQMVLEKEPLKYIEKFL